jgi:SAM-dependent methyltransferase
MHLDDAVRLIEPAVKGHEGRWADLGAGSGLFTRALAAVLGPGSHVIAVDASASAFAALQRLAEGADKVSALHADFTQDLSFDQPLEGILLANSLHFVKDAGRVLAKLAVLLRPGGTVVLVEYDRRPASRWVPYPISISQLPHLADAAGLTRFTVVESQPSNYEGIIYAASATRG